MIKLSLYLGTLILGTNFSATSVSMSPSISVTEGALTVAESQLVALANAERRAHGVNELVVNELLVQVARQHSKEMCELGYFDHASPNPEFASPMKRYTRALGYIPRWARIGENLFYCSVVDPARGHKCLIESPRHRENMLDPRFEEIGVGAYVASDGRFWVTQLFLAQRD